jgi:DNA-binding transcriptional ArsR family regulator
MDRVFAALADPNRRRILDILKKSPGSSLGEVAAHFDMSRIGVLKHVDVLEEAGLVVSRREGRSRLLHLNTVPIQLIYDRWTSEYSALWAQNLVRLKFALEEDDTPEPPKSRRKP